MPSRSCDWGDLQKNLLVNTCEQQGQYKTCVFEDLNDRVRIEAKEWCKTVAPKKGDEKLVAKKANTDIKDFIDMNSSWMFQPDSTSFCLVHGKQCFAYPAFALKEHFRRIEGNETIDPLVDLRHEAPWVEDVARDMGKTIESGVWPLSICIGGLTCTEYSPLGKQARESGEHERHAFTWLAERQVLATLGLEDIFISECSDRYPAESLQADQMELTHQVFVLRVSPVQLGFPIRRRRTFTFGLSKKTVTWHGPKTHAEVQEDFEKWFARTTELTGSAFFVADDKELDDFVAMRSAKRRRVLPCGYEKKKMEEYIHVMIPPSALIRKQEYEAMVGEKGSLAGDFFADLEQSPTRTMRNGNESATVVLC